MNADILSVAMTFLIPYLAPVIILLGGVLFAERIAELLKNVFTDSVSNKRSDY